MSETVQVSTHIKRTRKLKMAYNVNPGDKSKVAAIKVAGKYLEDLGFRPDGFFEMVINDDNSLTIRPWVSASNGAPSQAN